jgi:hypothetical protein
MDAKTLEAIRKAIDSVPYGSVKITMRDGKPTLITKEETIKLD